MTASPMAALRAELEKLSYNTGHSEKIKQRPGGRSRLARAPAGDLRIGVKPEFEGAGVDATLFPKKRRSHPFCHVKTIIMRRLVSTPQYVLAPCGGATNELIGTERSEIDMSEAM